MSQTIDKNDVIDGLIDVSESMGKIPYEKPEILETAPEPEEMLDSVYHELPTPKEEYEQIKKMLYSPSIKINAYGMSLTVQDYNGEPIARGSKRLTTDDNASIRRYEEVYIGVERHWERIKNGDVKIKDDFTLTLYRGVSSIVTYNTSNEQQALALALEKLFQMRDIHDKDIAPYRTWKDYWAGQ